MRERIAIILFVAGALLCSCRHRVTPQLPAKGYDTIFTMCEEDVYGAFYAAGGLNSCVVALDLYSDGLTLNEQGRIEGSGTNLYFSDIFLSEGSTELYDGTYTADTTGAPETFLPGTYFQSSFTGCYLLNISDGALVSYRLLDNGTLETEWQGDTLCLNFSCTDSRKRAYRAHYKGVPRVNDRRDQPKETKNAGRTDI